MLSGCFLFLEGIAHSVDGAEPAARVLDQRWRGMGVYTCPNQSYIISPSLLGA